MVASLTPVPPGGDQPAPVNILLVDDQPGRLLTYRAILEPLGERLVEARSGMDALQRLMDEEFALILLDVNMPGMDGFETASMIHQHPRFEKTPIIFVTAVNVTDMDRLRGYKLGAVDYVMVPVIPEILRSKVVVLVELFRKRRELQRANRQLADANNALRLEKARELEKLNESLRQANEELGTRNRELHIEIGERSRAERQLIAADLRKDEFLATLAHELRNPLAPLQNAVNIRKLRRPEEADDPLQATMERQLSLLVRLIDDLLDVARITRDKLTLRPRHTTLEAVLQAAVETSSPLVESGHHALALHLPDAPVKMLVDQERLAQVFANLLNNAAKYSEPGGRIDVSATVDGDEVEVTVRDRGLGLAPEQMDSIFELGTQVDTAIERTRGGLGIGLTLVQRLVQMHGGRIRVRSAGLGQGSEFRVTLPRRMPGVVADDDSGELPLPPAATGTAAPCRALVVDDNRDAADTLAMMLELLGHQTRRLYDPQAVPAEVEAFKPHVVFLDVGMPGLSGYDLARLLRSKPGGDQLLLAAVTGWGQPEDRRRTREAGFDHHLVKPPELASVRDICASVRHADTPQRSESQAGATGGGS
ncbi:MAG TPA: response regulator [Xanthomonadaceae bacterium]|nr:response regulator [Xanthomonadaceae bacterium]